MAAKIIDGRAIAKEINAELQQRVEALAKRAGRPPRLASVLIGADDESRIYAESQRKAAERLGIQYQRHEFLGTMSQAELIQAIQRLNEDRETTGIVIQWPVPKAVNFWELTLALDPQKDVEGMHPMNMGGAVFTSPKRLVPCTAQAVMTLIESTKVDLRGKEAVIVGRSEMVGRPVSLLLLDRFATTTVCHSATSDRKMLEEHVGRAEVLVVAVGRPELVKGEWVRPGAIVVDVGINKVGDRIVGDVEFGPAKERAGFITPVPGGVGPVTVSMLMKNVVQAFEQLGSGPFSKRSS